ncbi:hypothetical protein IAT38_000404 [Cryptococcus sp. DSM 104549]
MLGTPLSSSARRSTREHKPAVPFDGADAHAAAMAPPPAKKRRGKRQDRGEVLKAKQETAIKVKQEPEDVKPTIARLVSPSDGPALYPVPPSFSSGLPNKRPWEAVDAGPSRGITNSYPEVKVERPEVKVKAERMGGNKQEAHPVSTLPRVKLEPLSPPPSARVKLEMQPEVKQERQPEVKQERQPQVKAEPLPTPPAAGSSQSRADGLPVAPLATSSKAKGKAKVKTPVDPAKERLARCPKTITDRFKRATSQRMFMLDREKVAEQPSPIERFKALGSTGNVYTVSIGQIPRCDCPDFLKGNMPCKHIIFVYIKALKVDVEDTVWYQKSLTTEEAVRIFAQAPPSLSGSVAVSDRAQQAYLRATGAISEDEVIEDMGGAGSKRKSAIGEDCPVCYEEMTEADDQSNKLVYDESIVGCGRPLHRECFTMWSATNRAKRNKVTCVWCRAPWEDDDHFNKGKGKATYSYSSDGHMNLADQAGMSRLRDVSTYYMGHRYLYKD